MNQSARIFILLIAGISFFSCEEEVTPPQIEDAEDKVVVNGLLAPSFEQINVQVSKSRNAFGNIDFSDSDLITDAIVVISDGTFEQTMTYDPEIQQYTLSTVGFPIEEGVTYRINVTALGKTVSGETTVPKGDLTLESGRIVEGYKVEVIWEDVADEVNYYRLVADGDPGSGAEYREPLYFDGDEFVSDFNRDGQLLSASGEGYQFGGGYNQVIVRLISCEEIYFKYYEILVNYEGEDPFADPVRLPSNIDGGLGIFSSVNISEFEIER